MDERVIHPIGNLTSVEWRSSGDGKNLTLNGYASVYNRMSENLGGFYEKIADGAFDDVLGQSTLDCRALINHDGNLVLGRRSVEKGIKTLNLGSDTQGLEVWTKTRPTSYALDLRMNMEDGNVDQMSFAFYIGEDEETGTRDGLPVYTITRVSQLFDVSVVTYPAYPDTSASLRSRFIAEASRRYGVEVPVLRSVTQDEPAGEGGATQDEPAGDAERDHEREAQLRKLRTRARVLVVRYPREAA